MELKYLTTFPLKDRNSTINLTKDKNYFFFVEDVPKTSEPSYSGELKKNI